MVSIIDYNNQFFYPEKKMIENGLEEVIRFPDGEYKSEGIPNSTIWKFNKRDHNYQNNIHKGDLGCGMTAFLTSSFDHKEAADILYNYLSDTGILGRGNHFVDLCSSIRHFDDDKEDNEPDYNILFLHTHGKDHSVPLNFEQALKRQEEVKKFRVSLGYDLIRNILKIDGDILGDYMHNTVEEDNNHFIYRKGLVKVKPGEVYLLPSNSASKILLYTIHPQRLPPESSMPHATGRVGPRGETKVSLEKAAELRDLVYIPEGIKNSSLRTEHPDCFNNYDNIFKKLREENNFFIPYGECDILSYIGKI